MTQQDKIFLYKRKKYNKRIVAQYLALYTENMHLNKCLVTLTPSDGKLSTTLKLRKDFFKKLNSYKMNKKDGDKTIKYFSNIEFTQQFVSHLHIQLFYTNITAIQKSYNSIVNHKVGNTSQNSLSIAKNNNLVFTYIIKDYLNTDLSLERLKQTRNIKYITSSRKAYTNQVIRYLVSMLSFKTKNKYKEILDFINEDMVQVRYGYVRNKPKGAISKKVGVYTVIVFINKKRCKKITYKIKRLIKNKKRHRRKCVF
ncbi:rolling circle replication-associated protein [Arcobacter sp. YIC-464]|uniref:rolling circle replication-associated protein n=1 Tax=Arcobacter sp. YIC-464 TaxID=3376631 RepID=UPI003C288C1F